MPAFNYSIYEARNLAATESYVFLGKGNVNDTKISTENKCSSTFLFASIIGGKNTRIDSASENEPYIMIDTKWYAFRSAGNDSLNLISANNVISRTEM